MHVVVVSYRCGPLPDRRSGEAATTRLRDVEGHPDAWGATPAPLGVDSPLSALAADFRAALAAPDVRGARSLVARAAQAGAPLGRLYVDVLRPALVELQGPGRTVGARLAAGIGEAILADLVGRLPALRSGRGRAAVLVCRDGGIEDIDGTVATDFLETAGWTVQRLRGETPEREVPALAGANPAELAVVVTAGPADALRLAPVCTALRHLADPPVILLCDFSGPSRRRAPSASLGADLIAHDPDELLRGVAQPRPRRVPGWRAADGGDD
jgi:hypothetical protein